jgi:phospholipase/lecithinase/hemolysin
MQHFKLLATVLGAALLVSACGGGGNGDQSPAVKYSAVVTFGDSLSDPGAYKVGAISTLGGGMFTVNGIAGAVGADPVPSYNWAQLVSAAAIGTVSCAAREGGFGVAVVTKAGCTNYAQGGSRVTFPMGPGNTVGAGDYSAALTEPVVTQVSNFLAASTNNRFTGTELVTVLAGANDLFGLF